MGEGTQVTLSHVCIPLILGPSGIGLLPGAYLKSLKAILSFTSCQPFQKVRMTRKQGCPGHSPFSTVTSWTTVAVHHSKMLQGRGTF